MHRLSHTPPARAPRRGTTFRRIGVAIAGAATLLAAVAAPAGVASAERAHTSSATIAARAQVALTALGSWHVAHTPSDFVRFVRARDAVAELIATDLVLPVGEVRDHLAAPALTNQHAALSALTQLGVPYRSQASEPGVAFDCSGLTSFAFGAAGVSLPRSSGDQMRSAAKVARDDAEVGDLVHYPGHVGMYLGGNIYVHSPEPGRTVEVVVMPERSLTFVDLTP